MKQNHEWQTIRIGLLVAFALVAAALAIVGITSRQKLFERKVEYYSFFPDAAGLKEGSGVWYQGVEVGFISKIAFSPDVDNQDVQVYYTVSAALMPRIRTGTRATIKTLGMLGDKYLSLTTPSNSGNQATILPGNEIPIDRTVNLEALTRGAQDLIGNTTELSKNINQLISSINSGKGPLPRLLNDPELGKVTVDQLSQISTSLTQISTSLAGGHGLAGKLLMDPAYGEQTARDLQEAVARTNAILKDAQDGKGAFGALVSKGGDGEEMVANLKKTSDALARAAAAFDRPGSLPNKLFMDDEYGEKLAGNLLSISESMASILKKVDKGEGTLGALINDRSVYDSLAAVADGIKKSPIVGWYLKRKAEKAAMAEKRVADAEEQQQPKGTHKVKQ